MALSSLAAYKVWANITSTDADRDAALTVHLAEVEDAIKRLVYPTMLEAGTASNHVQDAPWGTRRLYLPLRPVRALTSLYVRQDAKGDPSLFTSDFLKVAYTDYRLVIDLQPEGWAKAGAVEILNASFWGATFRRPHGRLGFEVVDVPGAILTNYTYGYTSVPAVVVAAVHLATSMLYNRRKTGLMVTSGSLNGASWSGGGVSAESAVRTPDVMALLQGFYDPIRIGS